MEAKVLEPTTPVQHIQQEWLTEEQHGYRLWYLSLDLSGNIAISGYCSSGRTYISLYSGNNANSRDKLQLFYSKEFAKYLHYLDRYVSFLDKNFSKIVTCIGNKIQIIDTKNKSKVLRSCRVNDVTRCLAVREGEIFIGFWVLQAVLVFNKDLKPMKKIEIKGIEAGHYPCDLQVIIDTVFVCTLPGFKALSSSAYDRSIVSEYTDPTGMYKYAISIAVSEEMSLVAVLWDLGRIIVYSLNENKSFLVFNVDHDVTRIRISDRDKMIITGNFNTGEIKMYGLEQLFSFEALKRTLANIVSPNDYEELRKYFRVTDAEIQRRLEVDEDDTVKKMKCLLTVIEEKRHLNPNNMSTLLDAMSTLGDDTSISYLKGPIEGYSLHGSDMQTTLAEMMTRQKVSEDERNQLRSKLEAAESKVKEYEKTLDNLQNELVHVTKQAQEQEMLEDRDFEELNSKGLNEERMRLTEELQQSSEQIETLKEELKQIRTRSTKERQTLTDELKQNKAESDRHIKTLTERFKQSKAESERQIKTLKEELKETKQSKTESDRKIETLTEELKQTEQSKTESDRKIQILTEELTQIRIASTKKMEALTEELKKTQMMTATKIEQLRKELKQSKTDSNGQIESLTKKLKQTNQSKAVTIEKITQVKRESPAKVSISAISTEELEKSIEYLDLTKRDYATELQTLTTRMKESETTRKYPELTTQTLKDRDNIRTELKQYQTVFAEESKTLKEVLNQPKEAMSELHKRPVEDKLFIDSEETGDEGGAILAEADAFVNVEKDVSPQLWIRNSKRSLGDCTEPEYASQTEAKAQHTGAGDESRRSLLECEHQDQLYTEHTIGREGGNIQLENVSLTIPADALNESHVIALSVMNESPFPLDREVDTARMTPIIKLEPLGLMFTKSLQLKIPHSALIYEPENYNVIIYSGQITKNDKDSSDSIRWTEERSIPIQLREKSVTVDIQCLTYLSASLVSQISAPPLYIVRAVPFVDGVRDTNDDIVLTVCFCSDNDLEYKMLLSDYNTKLPLAQYSTIQLFRHAEKDEDDAGFLSMTVTSRNNTYVPDADQAVKFSIPHLCTASRVSHQVRLQKDREIDRDDVQVLLKFSQAGRTPTEIFIKARIKDLMISQESEDLLIGSLSTALRPYNELKANISSMLENYHCIQLATYFELTPAEKERVTIDASPGGMLMKILDEREKIMPQKMFDLYQGLKVCHLDKIAQLVLEYIEKNSKGTRQEKQASEKDKCLEALKPYNELKETISSMLETNHCIRLAAYFDLTPAEKERITMDASPGRILVKILDESEKMMPQKMFYLYQGLKVCHLDKIARLVYEFIEKTSNEIQLEKHKNERDTFAKGIPENASVPLRPLQKRQNRRSRIDKMVQTTFATTPSSSVYVLKKLNQELRPNEDRTSKTSKYHSSGGIVRYILPMFLDGILQTQRGVFTLNQELRPNEDRTSKTSSITRRPYTILKWIKYHFGIVRHILPMFLDGILQTQRGVFTLNQELRPNEDRTSKTSSITCRPYTILKWIKYHFGIVRHILPMFLDGILQTQRGAFTIKDLIIPEESSKLLLDSVTPGNKMYEDMLVNISSSLDTEKCRELAYYFQLTSEDTELVISSQDSGKMLIKTLEEKSLIDSQKMVYFFEGLKACHLDETAKLVSEYISKISKFTQEEGKKHEEGKHIEDVQNTSSNMHTDQTITNVGGTMCISGTDVRLKILPNSLPTGVEQARIRMEIISGRLLWSQPVHSFGSNSSVVVELLPNHLQLQRCAMLTLPHCLKLKRISQNVVKVFVSHHSKDSKPCWEEKPHLDYQLDDKALILHLDTFCWVKYEIDDEEVEAKKIQVFAARPKISHEDTTTKVELGYYPDLPGAGEILKNNKHLVIVEKKPFLFLREGSADLEIVGSHITPAYWEYCGNEENVKKISFRMIAASVEVSCPLHLRRVNIGAAYCVFRVSQKRQASEIVELSVLMKPAGDVPVPTSRAGCNAMDDKMLDCFMFLKRNLVNDWKDVGRYLEVPEADLSSFSTESSIGESIYQMLIYWQHRNASEASTERLVEALKKLDRKDLIEGITKILT